MAKGFETVIRLKMAQYGPEEARKRHIAMARQGLAEFMAQQPTRPMVRIEVDNRQATTEDAVRPFGLIVYRFSRMREIVSFALREAEEESPNRSGRYKRSWFPMHGGREIGLDEIPPGAAIMVTNDQPYSRKINVGAKGYEKYKVPSGVVERVRQKVLQRYRGIVSAEIQYITIGGGYVLRRDLGQLRQNGRRGTTRRDSRTGSALTYPTLVLTPRF